MPQSSGPPPTVVVAGGKDGVGKTTVAVGLAVALGRCGLRVGLADADVHGPDVLRMLGLTRRQDATTVDLWRNPRLGARRIAPIETHGIAVVSPQMFLGEAQDFSAPGFSSMLLDRMLATTEWGDADCLIVDLPPGTGEITQHVLASASPAGVLVVVTPQDVAHLDARKLVSLLERFGIPIFGGIENMAPMECPNCATQIELFPATADERSIWSTGIERLVRIPFSAAITQVEGGGAAGSGTHAFSLLADEVARRLSI